MRLFYLNLYNCSTSLPLYFANPGKSLISILVLAVLSWDLIYLSRSPDLQQNNCVNHLLWQRLLRLTEINFTRRTLCGVLCLAFWRGGLLMSTNLGGDLNVAQWHSMMQTCKWKGRCFICQRNKRCDYVPLSRGCQGLTSSSRWCWRCSVCATQGNIHFQTATKEIKWKRK